MKQSGIATINIIIHSAALARYHCFPSTLGSDCRGFKLVTPDILYFTFLERVELVGRQNNFYENKTDLCNYAFTFPGSLWKKLLIISTCFNTSCFCLVTQCSLGRSVGWQDKTARERLIFGGCLSYKPSSTPSTQTQIAQVTPAAPTLHNSVLALSLSHKARFSRTVWSCFRV